MIAISAQIFCLAPVLLYWTISSESLYSKQSTLTEPLILINNIILPSSSSILNLPLSTKLHAGLTIVTCGSRKWRHTTDTGELLRSFDTLPSVFTWHRSTTNHGLWKTLTLWLLLKIWQNFVDSLFGAMHNGQLQNKTRQTLESHPGTICNVTNSPCLIILQLYFLFIFIATLKSRILS